MRCSAAALLALVALAPIGALALEPGHAAPTFVLEGTAGERIRLEDHRGKVVLLNFWATWCRPCREELPRLEALHQRHRARGFVVLGVNLDTARNADKARALVKRLGLRFPVAFDPDQRVAERYELEQMPSSFLIDGAGVVRYVHSGFRAKDAATIEARVERELSRSDRRGTRRSASE